MPYATGERKQKPASGLDPRTCATCGVEFQPYRSTQIYCSAQCSNNGPQATATRQAYLARPEIREVVRARRRIETTSDVERLRRYNLRSALKKYGVTPDQYTAMLAQQNGVCAICGDPPKPGGVKAASRLHVDHCHTTSAVRDLLCSRCNQGVGYFRENPDLLREAAAYIERHRASD